MWHSPNNHDGAGPRQLSFPSGLIQPTGAMRFAVDSLLLAAFAAASMKERPLRVKNPLRESAFAMSVPGCLAGADLGCGSGAATLALLRLTRTVKVWGVDIVDELVACARQNARAFSQGVRASFEVRDVASLTSTRRPCCDFVLMNPPFWKEGEGRPSSKPMNNLARRSSEGLAPFMRAARKLVVFHGRLFIIFPAVRIVSLLEEMAAHGFGVRRLRAVRPYADAQAGRVLVEGQRDAAHETVWEPDMVLYERCDGGKGVPTPGAKAFCPWLR